MNGFVSTDLVHGPKGCWPCPFMRSNQHIAQPRTMQWRTFLSCAYVAVVDDDFDDDELLELAQAGRSQREGSSSHHAKSTHDTAPTQHAKASVLNSNPGQVGSIAEPLKSPAADEQQPAKASAAQDDYLELDDDELLELACTSMDPQQDNAQTALGGMSTVPKSAAELSRSDLPGVPQPGSRETNLGESGAETARLCILALMSMTSVEWCVDIEAACCVNEIVSAYAIQKS